MGEIYPDEEPKSFNQNRVKKPSLVTLDAYGINISKQAAEGKLDPVVGREDEILRVIQILGRRRKNNPVLVGEPGVGKTAIVEGLAMKIIEGNVPSSLLGKIIYTLELSTIVAGTKYRGQFEERMKAIVDELSANPHVIIFIDELHTLVGAGGSSGSLDASNIIKPALARGEIRCIGATTFDEFRENIEEDGALDRRFQKVVVEPPSTEETETILLNIRHKYESYHNVSYSDGIIALIVKLANDYVIDRYFPDKAVDILDEVGSYKHLVDMKVPKKIKALEERLSKKEQAKVNAVAKQDYELAAKERDLCVSLKTQIEKEYEEWKTYISENKLNITEEDVLTVVSKSTGIPLERITDKENKNLLGINDYLSSRIIGQKEAIDKIAITIQRNRIGIRKRDRTAGNFIFLGPTGVGKCVTGDTLIKVKNNNTGEISKITISEFKKLIKNE
jgi:ATP-dependent Clp protease ATP-binding subunit ClpC